MKLELSKRIHLFVLKTPDGWRNKKKVWTWNNKKAGILQFIRFYFITIILARIDQANNSPVS